MTENLNKIIFIMASGIYVQFKLCPKSSSSSVLVSGSGMDSMFMVLSCVQLCNFFSMVSL